MKQTVSKLEKPKEKKSKKYCCEKCEKSVNNHSDLTTHFGSDALWCQECDQPTTTTTKTKSKSKNEVLDKYTFSYDDSLDYESDEYSF